MRIRSESSMVVCGETLIGLGPDWAANVFFLEGMSFDIFVVIKIKVKQPLFGALLSLLSRAHRRASIQLRFYCL